MCGRIIFDKDDFTEEELRKAGLEIKGSEIDMKFWEEKPLLPIEFEGKHQLVQWGNRSNKESKLPQTGWAKKESVEKGKWSWLHPVPVKILAKRGWEKGVWFKINEGIEGILIKDEKQNSHCYMLTEEASYYFKTMTKHERMPVLINQNI